jgi:hypothetical protein
MQMDKQSILSNNKVRIPVDKNTIIKKQSSWFAILWFYSSYIDIDKAFV